MEPLSEPAPASVGSPTDSATQHGNRGARPLYLRTQTWIWEHTLDRAQWLKGLSGAILSPLFLGLAPIFAKQAFRSGAAPFTVIAMRMTLASGALWIAYLLFARKYVRSWWLGISASALAGIVNGVGSICYYQALARIDASLASLLNISYLVFVTLILRILGQTISRLTIFRLALALAAVALLAQARSATVDMLGVTLLLTGALAYAIQLVIGQRVLYDIPSPTMTLYSMSAMAVVVNLAWLLGGGPELESLNGGGWPALLAFAGVTAFSRLTLFQGVKHLGSVQTAALGVSEALVTVLLAMLFFDETLVTAQWLGAALMIASVMLLAAEKDVPRLVPFPLLPWIIKASSVLQRREKEK